VQSGGGCGGECSVSSQPPYRRSQQQADEQPTNVCQGIKNDSSLQGQVCWWLQRCKEFVPRRLLRHRLLGILHNAKLGLSWVHCLSVHTWTDGALLDNEARVTSPAVKDLPLCIGLSGSQVGLLTSQLYQQMMIGQMNILRPDTTSVPVLCGWAPSYMVGHQRSVWPTFPAEVFM